MTADRVTIARHDDRRYAVNVDGRPVSTHHDRAVAEDRAMYERGKLAGLAIGARVRLTGSDAPAMIREYSANMYLVCCPPANVWKTAAGIYAVDPADPAAVALFDREYAELLNAPDDDDDDPDPRQFSDSGDYYEALEYRRAGI